MTEPPITSVAEPCARLADYIMSLSFLPQASSTLSARQPPLVSSSCNSSATTSQVAEAEERHGAARQP